MSMLKMDDLYSYYGSSPVLKRITFHITEGAIVGILGRNGVGKTTLLRTIMGLTDHVKGALAFLGSDIKTLPTYRRAQLGIGYIPQGRDVIPTFTVRQNLLLGMFGRQDRARKIPDHIYDIFPVLREMDGRRGGDLSGGQQQQLAIARALCTNPTLLLFDEPTEGIQPNIVADLEKVIVRLNAEFGITVLLVEQNIGFVRRACTNVIILDKGQVAFAGTNRELDDDLVRKHMTV